MELEKKRFYGWTVLATASLVLFVIMGGVLVSFGVFMPSICRELGWSRGGISGAYTMMMMLTMLGGPLAGDLWGDSG